MKNATLQKSVAFAYWVLEQLHPEQLPQFPLQAPELGQPMHFLPLFFAL